MFASMALTQVDDAFIEEELSTLYRKASSGHKIVLLSMTRLVELVGERTLVLIDEPEAHLHPPLAASFIRALSALLANRNGIAILATHSPVMLQEVPQECVWLLFRTGLNVDNKRRQVETFAENLGVLTREVFRLEVTNSGGQGFHNRENGFGKGPHEVSGGSQEGFFFPQYSRIRSATSSVAYRFSCSPM